MSTWKKTVASIDAGKKLETFLLENGFTKREISRLKFKNPGMHIDGQQAKSTALLQTGQLVQIFLADQNFNAEYITSDNISKNNSIPLDLLYEDNELLVVNKPSGLSCHPGKGHYNENLGSIVSAYCFQKGITCPIREIGRLDKDTSGIVLFAKNRDTAARLWQQRKDGNLYKTYTILVHGTIKNLSGQITFDMEAVPDVKNRMRTCQSGLTAITNYNLIQHSEFHGFPVSLLECRLETGRTHQIRVHMAAAGHPVVGDTFYGIDDSCKRLCLHAGEVTFYQPYTHEKIHLTVPFNYEQC